MIRATPRRGRSRTLALVAACTLPLIGCANSKFLVGAVYDRVDDRVMKGARDWVDLDDAQRSELAAYVGTAHTWHRLTQLPRYTALLRDMTSTLSAWGRVTPADFDRWLVALEEDVAAFRACHPANFSAPLTRGLSDAQVASIEAEWQRRETERASEDGERTRAQRIDERVEKIGKGSRRIGLDLDERQLEMLRATFFRQRSLGDEYRTLSEAWYARLFELLDERREPGFDARVQRHVADWFGLLERAYPDAWQRNLELWRKFAIDLEKTLSRRQRRDTLRWVNKFADTLESISRDEPDYLPADDPAYGCTVAASGGASADPAGERETR